MVLVVCPMCEGTGRHLYTTKEDYEEAIITGTCYICKGEGTIEVGFIV